MTSSVFTGLWRFRLGCTAGTGSGVSAVLLTWGSAPSLQRPSAAAQSRARVLHSGYSHACSNTGRSVRGESLATLNDESRRFLRRFFFPTSYRPFMLTATTVPVQHNLGACDGLLQAY